MTAQPIKDYHIEFAKDDDGTDLENRFIFTAKKPIAPLQSEVTAGISIAQKMLEAICSVDGMDFYQPVGRYSMEIVVAKTFDPQDVIAAIVETVRPIQSDIVLPSLVK
jgi:hydrogenase maturation factor